jgi:GntR family transcriptional regulator
VRQVEGLIAERGLRPGDLLPSYGELAAQSGVSLITVRRALDELERAGKVRRHQGLGTFVARPRIVTEPARAGSLLEALTGGGRPAQQLETRVLEIRPGQASHYLAGALRLDGGRVWRLRRLRLIDSQPAVVETSVIPESLAPDLGQRAGQLTGSLYELLDREYGLQDTYEEQYLEVVRAASEDARLLEIAARSYVVRIRGLSAGADGTPFDCFEQLYPAAAFAFAIAGGASRQLLPAPGERDWEVRPD